MPLRTAGIVLARILKSNQRDQWSMYSMSSSIHLFEGNGASAVDLPQAGNARADTKATALPILVESLVVAHGKRARTDQAHVAFQHIEELRQLIDAHFPQELPDTSNARIILELEHRATGLVEVLNFVDLSFCVRAPWCGT